MTYSPKTITDNAGDVTQVSVDSDGDVRVVQVEKLAFFTPKKARKLAKALVRAANASEGLE